MGKGGITYLPIQHTHTHTHTQEGQLTLATPSMQ